MARQLIQCLILLSLFVHLCSNANPTKPLITYMHQGIRCVKCAPGTYFLAHCDKEDEDAHCRLCPSGTYSSEYNIATSCDQCKTACEHEDLVPVTNCTYRTNMACACPEGKYNINAHLDLFHAKCMEYGKCDPGYGVKDRATSVSNTTCERCLIGRTYSPSTSEIDGCQICTECRYLDVLYECNGTHDRICKEKEHITNRPKSSRSLSMDDIYIIVGVVILCFVIGIAVTIAVIYFCKVRLPCPNQQEQRHQSEVSAVFMAAGDYNMINNKNGFGGPSEPSSRVSILPISMLPHPTPTGHGTPNQPATCTTGQRSPNQPAPTGYGTPNQPAPTGHGTLNQPATTGQRSPNQPAPTGHGTPNQPATTGQRSPYQPARTGHGTPNQPAPTGHGTPNQPATTGQRSPYQPAPTGHGTPNQPAPTGHGTPNQPAPTGHGTPNQPAPTGHGTPNQPATTGQRSPYQPAPTRHGTPKQPATTGQRSPNQPAPTGHGTPNQPATTGQQPPYPSVRQTYLGTDVGRDHPWKDNLGQIMVTLSEELINADSWKRIIRQLYEDSGHAAEQADKEIKIAESDYRLNLREQIYQCCTKWSGIPSASPHALSQVLLKEDCKVILKVLQDKFPIVFRFESTV